MLVFTHANFQLDLTYLNVTFSEINQWFKDDFSTEQSFPFDLYLDSELSKNSGFQNHYNSNNNQTIFTGVLDKDGEIVDAVLTFQGRKGKIISAIIKAGLDNFPSFNKKLSELNLEKKPVADIIADANLVIRQGYPAVNYNFGMIHTAKYDPATPDWNGFQKIINHYSGGDFLTNVLVEEDIDEIKTRSETYKAYLEGKIKSCTWVSDYGEMARKTVIKRIYKYLPRTERMEKIDEAIKHDNSDFGASDAQVYYIENLLNNSTLDERQRSSLEMEVPVMGAERAGEVIAMLQANQQLSDKEAFRKLKV